jgi:hypothetical protein
MLDVHPPTEPVHGIRDFLIHLLTITVGLLIALSLEGCVEMAHHRHLRKEADANLRQEILDNRKDLSGNIKAVVAEQKNLLAILGFLNHRLSGEKTQLREITIDFRMSSLRNSSWQTASATGALSLMEYAHVQKYAEAYQIQDEFSKLQSLTLSDFLELQSFMVGSEDPNLIGIEQAKAASTDVRRALSHLHAMEQFEQALDKTYQAALDESKS